MSLSELVEVQEELFNTNAVHDNEGAETVLNVGGIVRDFDTGLLVTMVNNVERVGRIGKEGGINCWWDTKGVHWRSGSDLGDVAGENIVGFVKIHAEFPVVDLSRSAAVAVLSNNEVIDNLVMRHKTERLEDSQELVLCNVQLLGPVEVHEAGLKQNALSLDFVVHLVDGIEHAIFLVISEYCLSSNFLNGGRWVHFV
jgi:hypothetical protein